MMIVNRMLRAASGIGLCLLMAAGPGAGFYARGASRAAAPAAKSEVLAGKLPAKPSIAPRWKIPVEDLGFAAPGANYLGQRNALVSLDFLDEDRMLFTYRVPGLMRREPASASEDQREIRAVVLDGSSGAVLARTEWTLHDRERYLWAAGGGRFLLRDLESIYELDASLNRKPILHFPGPVEWMSLNPAGDLIVTDSWEPEKRGGGGSEKAQTATGDGDDTGPRNMVLRILKRNTGQVMLVKRLRTASRPAIAASGILEALRGNGQQWEVVEDGFAGETRPIGEVKSACTPRLDLVSEKVALATACMDSGGYTLTALDLAGGALWTAEETDRAAWPQLATAANGLRFAREALYVMQPVNAFDPMTTSEIKGQWVRVFDTATGGMVFEAPVAPVLDAGGNVALSPTGRRVAVLNGGAIEVFELPEAPPLPKSADASQKR